jgi:hydrogenase nickel incorporation protein HypA/HybF
MSIVQALIEQVEAEVEQAAQHGRVSRLDLVIGRLSGVHVDSIRFAFELLAPGTIAGTAELHIVEPRATLTCLECQAQCEMDDLQVQCPMCGSGQITIQGGNEVLLQSIELEDADEDCCREEHPEGQ